MAPPTAPEPPDSDDDSDDGSVLTDSLATPRAGSREGGAARARQPHVEEVLAALLASAAPNRPLHVVAEYAQSTGLLGAVASLLRMLLSIRALPANPYPGLVRRLRKKEQLYGVLRDDGDDPAARIFFDAAEAAPGSPLEVWRTAGVPAGTEVWGLRSLVRTVDPFAARLVAPAVLDAARHAIESAGDCRCAVLPSLAGAFVHYGGVAAHPTLLRIRQDYVVSGGDKARGIALFAQNVLRDASTFDSGEDRVFLVLCIAPRGEGDAARWTSEMVSRNREGLLAAVKVAVATRARIFIEGLFRLRLRVGGTVGSAYRLGRKEHVFHWRGRSSGAPALESTAAHAHESLCDGVFFERRHAETYSSLFEGRPSAALASAAVPALRMAIARDAHAGGMRSHAGNPYPAYERAALLASAEGRDDVLADLSRVGRTVAARLCAAAMQAHTLARVLEESARGGARSSVSVVLSAAFAEFCEDVGAMMGRSGAACLSELEALRPAVDRRLDALARHMQRPPQSSARVGPLVRHLESLARYLSAIGVHMLAEAVAAFAGARRYVAECVAGSAKELAAEHATARAARLAEQGGAASRARLARRQSVAGTKGRDRDARGRPDRARARTVASRDEGAATVDPPRADEPSLVLGVQSAGSSQMGPSSVRHEAAVLQYAVDVRLDAVFFDGLVEALTAPVLASNPYPLLVRQLRLAIHRLDHWSEPDASLGRRLQNASVPMVESQAHVYGLPGHQLYGAHAAVVLADAATVEPLLDRFAGAGNGSITWRQGSARVTLTTGFAGRIVLYGRMLPHLTDVEVREDYYAEGPSLDDALHLFARNVHGNAVDMVEKGTAYVHEIRVGDARWTVGNAMAQRSLFLADVARAAANRQAIRMRAYFPMDWRYVAVTKHFVARYGPAGSPEAFSSMPASADPTAAYRTLFRTRDKAALWLSHTAPDASGVASVQAAVAHARVRVRDDWQAGRVLSAYRWLLLAARAQKDFGIVPSVWRMLHSAAGDVEYLLGLNTTIRELVAAELETADVASEIPNDIDLGLLNEMYAEYARRVCALLATHSCTTTAAFNDAIRERLELLVAADSASADLELVIHEDTLTALEEIADLLQCVGDGIASEMHALCPDMAALVSSIVEDIPSRR